MIDLSGVVRTIPTLAPLAFNASFTFRIHPFKKLLCSGDPGVILAIKFVKICPLIAVLGSKVTPRGLISVTHFTILSLASRFFIKVLSGYFVSMTMWRIESSASTSLY